MKNKKLFLILSAVAICVIITIFAVFIINQIDTDILKNIKWNTTSIDEIMVLENNSGERLGNFYNVKKSVLFDEECDIRYYFDNNDTLDSIIFEFKKTDTETLEKLHKKLVYKYGEPTINNTELSIWEVGSSLIQLHYYEDDDFFGDSISIMLRENIHKTD